MPATRPPAALDPLRRALDAMPRPRHLPAAPVARQGLASVSVGRPPSAPPAIEARGLTKLYGGRPALDGLSFRVPRGGVTGFVGPNGSGKTTTLRVLLGLVRPDAGAAMVLGHPLAAPRRYLPRVGALIESPAFDPHLSGRRNLKALATLGGTSPARIPVVLEQVGLSARADDAFKGYSLGMKQRLGIAAALLADPELLVLDEPTNGLDPAGIREVRDLLRALGRAGKTVLVSSHLVAEVERACDHLVVVRAGRLAWQGTVAGLKRATQAKDAAGLEDALLGLTGRGSL